MKKILHAFSLILMINVLISSCNTNNHENDSKPLTASQLDSIRHKEINDSINNLDTIKIMKVLFMGMTPEEYKSLSGQVSLILRIGRLQYWGLDTSLYHNTVHNIYLKSTDTGNAYDLDDMKYKIISGEETFKEVVKTLSQKYGSPTYINRMSEINDNGFQRGVAWWEFDKFCVEYEQKQWARLINNTHRIEAMIKYSIPRIPTKEEKNKTDSIIKVHEQQRIIEENRNNELKRNL